jgi:F0F1-type ATP synthase epsilon subunit
VPMGSCVPGNERRQPTGGFVRVAPTEVQALADQILRETDAVVLVIDQAEQVFRANLQHARR